MAINPLSPTQRDALEKQKNHIPVEAAGRPQPGLLGRLCRGGLGVTLVAAVGLLFGIYIYTQVLLAIRFAGDLSFWGRIFGLIALLPLVFVFLWCSFGWLRIWFLFRRSCQSLSARGAFIGRTWQQDAKSRRQLLKYLQRDFDLEKADVCRSLEKAGLTLSEIDQLRAARQRLLDGESGTESHAWVGRFKKFQETLDAGADRAIRRRSVLVGVKTASIPFGWADAFILLWHHLRLLEQLCSIYRVRYDGITGLYLLTSTLIAVLVGGYAQEGAEAAAGYAAEIKTALEAETGLTDATAEAIGEVAWGSLAGVAGSLAPKLTEGTLHGLFLYRLGSAAKRRLRLLA